MGDDSPDGRAFPPILAACKFRSGEGSFPPLEYRQGVLVFVLCPIGENRAALQRLKGGSSRKNGDTEACRREEVNDDLRVFVGRNGAGEAVPRDLWQRKDKTMVRADGMWEVPCQRCKNL